MIICISGTPGCGKTTVSRILSKSTGFKLIEVNDFAKERNLIIGCDVRRKCEIVDTRRLRDEMKGLKGNIVIAGHLAHFAMCDICIILRTNPKELEQRIKKKGWDMEKVRENVEAEILDICLSEAVGEHGLNSVFEVDTTGKAPKNISEEIKTIINGKNRENWRPGKIDWTKHLKIS